MTDFISYQFFLRCQGMAHVCSLSLLLAWKGISKLLWQMLALSPPCPAQHWNLAHAQTRTYRSTRQQRQTVVHWFWMGKMATLILATAEDDVVIIAPIHTASQKKNGFLLSTHSQRRKKGRGTDRLNLCASRQWQHALHSIPHCACPWYIN